MSLAATAARFAQVAIPVPLRRLFTYRIPETLAGQVVPGSVVQVPFGNRKTSGFVVELATETALAEVKEITGVEDAELSLPREILDLCAWVSDYYLAPPGEVLRAALPAGLGRKTPGDVPHAAGSSFEIHLGPEQEAALGALTGALEESRPRPFLLYGVTGSGKTEVYLRAAERVVARGGKALILIPEIALSPQMVQRVEARFGSRVALWHSALTPSRRREVWARTRKGKIDVLVGARSAVFAPLPDLQLIVVDEEHESAYKQTESPRYHARDTALVRGRAQGAVVVLGSATPSLESFANARKEKYRLLTLPHRVAGRARSQVDLVPFPRREEGKPSPVSLILGDPLRDALAATLAKGEQSLLFLNRRGHSTMVQCESCREPLACSQCDLTLTWHSVSDQVICHVCGGRRPTPASCPRCEGPVSVFRGMGTQRVAQELTRLFAGVRIVRLDTDATRKRGALAAGLETFRRGEADILLGTQMVAKGLDFPTVTLVGVIHADLGLTLPDFRSAERTFQLLTQVAGRSGRGPRPGRVFFQTARPDHEALVAAAAQDYDMFYRGEIEARRDPPYPPHRRLVNLLFDGRDEARVVAAAEETAAVLHARLAASPLPAGVELMGPAPQPFSRLKGKHRWHITLRGTDHRVLHELAEAALDHRGGVSDAVRMGVDVDPVSLL